MIRRRGHTITEVLLVLTILVLFAVVALPRFVSSLSTSRLDAAIDAYRGDLEFARSRAIATGSRHYVMVDTQTGELIVVPFRADENALQQQGGSQQTPAMDEGSAAGEGQSVLLRETLPDGIQLVDWTVSPLGLQQQTGAQSSPAIQDLPLTFYAEGQGDAARLILENAEGQRRGILVDPVTGEIRMLDPEEMQ